MPNNSSKPENRLPENRFNEYLRNLIHLIKDELSKNKVNNENNKDIKKDFDNKNKRQNVYLNSFENSLYLLICAIVNYDNISVTPKIINKILKNILSTFNFSNNELFEKYNIINNTFTELKKSNTNQYNFKIMLQYLLNTIDVLMARGATSYLFEYGIRGRTPWFQKVNMTDELDKDPIGYLISIHGVFLKRYLTKEDIKLTKKYIEWIFKHPLVYDLNSLSLVNSPNLDQSLSYNYNYVNKSSNKNYEFYKGKSINERYKEELKEYQKSKNSGLTENQQSKNRGLKETNNINNSGLTENQKSKNRGLNETNNINTSRLTENQESKNNGLNKINSVKTSNSINKLYLVKIKNTGLYTFTDKPSNNAIVFNPKNPDSFFNKFNIKYKTENSKNWKSLKNLDFYKNPELLKKTVSIGTHEYILKDFVNLLKKYKNNPSSVRTNISNVENNVSSFVNNISSVGTNPSNVRTNISSVGTNQSSFVNNPSSVRTNISNVENNVSNVVTNPSKSVKNKGKEKLKSLIKLNL
jgi:hypothetical protein